MAAKKKIKQAPILINDKNNGSEIKKDIWGVFFIGLGVFLFVSNNYPATTGLLGQFVNSLFYPIFGKGLLILPAFVVVLGLLLVSGFDYIHFFSRMAGIIVGFISAVTLIELYIKGIAPVFVWPPAYDAGGIIGYLSSYLLQLLIGIKGAYLVSWLSSLISLMMIFSLKIADIITFFVVILRVVAGVLKSLLLVNRERREAPQPINKKSKLVNKPSILSAEDKKDKYSVFNQMGMFEKEEKPKKRLAKSKKLEPTEEEVIKSEKEYKEVLKKTLFPEEKNLEKKVETQIHQLEIKLSEQESSDNYKLPPITYLNDHKTSSFKKKHIKEEILRTTQQLEETLASFKIDAKVVSIAQGPAVTRYEIQPGFGVKVSKIVGLSDDLSLALAAAGVRIEAPVPGKSVIGIEVPNKTVEMVNMLSLARSDKFLNSPDKLLVAIGLDIEGNPTFANIAQMPHLLVAGATGSGKSVCINTIILSILLRAKPDEVKFLMIDPKQVELSNYNGIPHLLAPVVTNPTKAAATLKWAVLEMNKRYEEFAAIGARNLESYNQKVEELEEEAANNKDPEDEIFVPQRKPYIVIIIDELADLMMVASSEVETLIARLAQMARATGIHMIVATQRPSVDVITGLIKANVPSRISFAVSSQIDSRTIIDSQGAEKLLGKGDMLYKPVGAMKPKRVQGVYISDKEISKVVSHTKKQGKVQYLDEVVNVKEDDLKLDIGKKGSSADNDGEDEMYVKSKELVQATGQASISFLQRKLKIGYNRAARIMDELEEKGIVSAYEGDAKTRKVMKFD